MTRRIDLPGSKPIVVTIEIGPGRDAWIKGLGHYVHPAIRAARSPRKYDVTRRAMRVPTSHVDDIAAFLELQKGVVVRVEQVLT